MNYSRWRRRRYCFHLSFLVLVACLQPALQAQDDSVATTVLPQFPTRIPPTSPEEIPASPVSYEFAGGGGKKICLVLTTQTTAVVRACSSDASLLFSTNLSPSVPIDLVQKRDVGQEMTCQLLIITTGSGNLQEGEFEVYYNTSSVQIKYGPLGLSNPTGGHILPFSASNPEIHLLYRPPDMSRVTFTVCRNGAIAKFSVTVPPPPECRLGTGAGGFSSHFDVSVLDIGQNPLSGQNFTITSGSCDDPNAGVSFAFTVPDEVLSTASILFTSPPTIISSSISTSKFTSTETSKFTSTSSKFTSSASPGHPITTKVSMTKDSSALSLPNLSAIIVPSLVILGCGYRI